MSTILDYMINTGKSPPGNAKQVSVDTASQSKVLKPQQDSNMGKQIMQNMESVIKSLKRRSKHKKHRQKQATVKLQNGHPEDGENGSIRVDTSTPADSESEEESLANLKKTWLSARPKRDSTENSSKTTPKTDPDNKKNAFQLLMLNGKSNNAQVSPTTAPSAPTPDENQKMKVSPEVGKRKLGSGHKDSAKRRKVKATNEGQPPAQVPAGKPCLLSIHIPNSISPFLAEVSPKSPTKKRRKKKLFECYVETVETKKPLESPQVQTIHNDTPTSTPSRPRRSCAANVIYKDDTSPVSTTATKKVSTITSTPQPKSATPAPIPLDETSPIIVDADESCDNIVAESTANDPAKVKKLAPLFVKAVPKPTVDPKVREARQSFLMSDIPDKMRQEIEKKKQVQEEVNARQLSLFPEVSHIPLYSNDMYLSIYDEDQLFPRPDPSDTPPLPRKSTFSLLRTKQSSSSSSSEEAALLHAFALLKTDHQKKQLVRNLKAESDGKFPSLRFYKWMVKRAEAGEHATSLFSDKYQPSNSKEFVFNLSAVNELKEYLESFNESSENASSYETDDECSNSMDAYGGAGAGKQTLVLHGNCSVGKTSAVYAIASELNYNVIEINASSKRNGSKVLHKLMEATQSHKVATTTAQKSAKMSLSRKVLRRMEREEQKMSIIFIEDVDVIFAEDNGFLAAITQLMSLTKRPIILTTNNRGSANLKKTFDAHPNFRFLHFRRPKSQVADCLTYLHLVGAAEGCNFDPDYLRHLFEELGQRDLRRSLLHMNFITMTKEVELKWSGETARIDIPCCNLEEDEVEGEDGCSDLAWTLDNLCVADRWTKRDLPELEEAFEEMCLLGNSLLDSRCDGTFYPEATYPGRGSM